MLVDVSARARRRATLARVGEVVPATGADHRPGATEAYLSAPHDAVAAGALPLVGRAGRIRRIRIEDPCPGDRPAPEELTGPIPRVPVDPSGCSDAATGPLPVVPARAADPLTEPMAAVAAPPAVGEQDPAEPVAPPRSGPGRAAVRATVLAVLLALVGGGASALAMDKAVVLIVDGQERTIHTFAPDVAGALASAGMVPTPQDRVEPALPTDLADGDHVIVSRARPLTLVEGGSEREVWTTAASVQEALTNLGMDVAPAMMSTAPDATIPLSGMALELRVPRAVTLADGVNPPVALTTTAGTVAGLLEEQGLTLGPEDVAVPGPDTELTEGTAVQIVRNGEGEVIEVRRIEPPEQLVEDPELPRGERVVVEEGRPGEQTAVVRIHVRNGQEVRREQVAAGSSTPPSPRIVRVGTGEPEPAPESEPESQAPTVDDGSVWDRLARCESTGDWSVNTGNGYYGGLQFDRSTWRAYDGDQYADLPHQASREEQIEVASRVRDDRGGYGAWPACSRKLGLPR